MRFFITHVSIELINPIILYFPATAFSQIPDTPIVVAQKSMPEFDTAGSVAAAILVYSS
jgi:hypothetical protein